jgi:hypothetical protein
MTMQTAMNISIESHRMEESKIFLERMACDSSRLPQHIDTDEDCWNKKMTRTDHQPPTMKRKRPGDNSMTGELEEEEEGQFSLSEQLLFKNLSEAISECCQEASEQRRHRGCARSNSHDDGALAEMQLQLNRNPSSEEPIIPNKRPRHQRRKSFVIRCDNKYNHPLFPSRSLLERYDDEDSPLNRSTIQGVYSAKPEMPSDMEAWGGLSWSNTNDTVRYKFSSMSFEDVEEPLIPEP